MSNFCLAKPMLPTIYEESISSSKSPGSPETPGTPEFNSSSTSTPLNNSILLTPDHNNQGNNIELPELPQFGWKIFIPNHLHPKDCTCDTHNKVSTPVQMTSEFSTDDYADSIISDITKGKLLTKDDDSLKIPVELMSNFKPFSPSKLRALQGVHTQLLPPIIDFTPKGVIAVPSKVSTIDDKPGDTKDNNNKGNMPKSKFDFQEHAHAIKEIKVTFEQGMERTLKERDAEKVQSQSIAKTDVKVAKKVGGDGKPTKESRRPPNDGRYGKADVRIEARGRVWFLADSDVLKKTCPIFQSEDPIYPFQLDFPHEHVRLFLDFIHGYQHHNLIEEAYIAIYELCKHFRVKRKILRKIGDRVSRVQWLDVDATGLLQWGFKTDNSKVVAKGIMVAASGGLYDDGQEFLERVVSIGASFRVLWIIWKAVGEIDDMEFEDTEKWIPEQWDILSKKVVDLMKNLPERAKDWLPYL